MDYRDKNSFSTGNINLDITDMALSLSYKALRLARIANTILIELDPLVCHDNFYLLNQRMKITMNF